MKKQTAVEWLVKELELDTRFNGIFKDVIDQANEMFKEQVIEGYKNGDWERGYDDEAEQWYNQTYKQ